MSLKEKIMNKRKINEKSVTQYLRCLNALKKSIGQTEEDELCECLTDYDKVMKYINSLEKMTTKKNKLTAVVVALDSCEADEKIINKYKDALKKTNDDYNLFLNKQIKTETQKKNWIEYSELVRIANDLLNLVKAFKNKDNITKMEYDVLQKCVLIQTHIEFPLRNDLAEVKIIKNDDYNKLKDKQTENYLVVQDKPSKMTFYFNHFKNHKSLGSLKMPVPKKLVNLYKIYFKYNKSDNFLTNIKDRQSPITPNRLTKLFNELFRQYYPDKKISSSLIRHIIISHLTKGQPTIKEKQEKKENIKVKFQHSEKTNDTYRKID